jgi:hypothetical protein
MSMPHPRQSAARARSMKKPMEPMMNAIDVAVLMRTDSMWLTSDDRCVYSVVASTITLVAREIHEKNHVFTISIRPQPAAL